MKRKVPLHNPDVLLGVRRSYTIGWCAAFVQFGRVYVVQRARYVP